MLQAAQKYCREKLHRKAVEVYKILLEENKSDKDALCGLSLWLLYVIFTLLKAMILGVK